jgi:hypothetical protein
MNLGQVLTALNDFDADQTIYVSAGEPVSEEPQAVVDQCSGDGSAPLAASGMRYLLEIALARDAIRVWSEWRDGKQPSLDEKVAAVHTTRRTTRFCP